MVARRRGRSRRSALGGVGGRPATAATRAGPPEPAARDRPRAPLRRPAHRQRPQPADLRRRRARRRRAACGCWSSPAAWSGSPTGDAARCSTSRARCSTGAEQGLLGIAFHPDFATNRRLYLHWCNRRGRHARGRVPRARASGVIDPRPVRRLLAVDQPEENHNGGQLAFGPDGRLYLGLGDGGGAFDPRATAQDPRLAARQGHRHAGRRPAALAHGADRACATRGASRSTRRWASCGSATSARTRSRRSTASRSSSTSRPRTSAGARSRGRGGSRGTRSTAAGELVWPVAAYSHAATAARSPAGSSTAAARSPA